MARWLIFVAVAAVSCMSAEAQIPTVGSQCPIKKPSSEIDLKQMSGKWYEVEASPSFLEYPYKCISFKVPSFFEKKTEITIDAVNRESKESGTVQKLSGKIPDSSNGKDGKVLLTMIDNDISSDGRLISRSHVREHYRQLPIQILATDYNNWALAWMCKRQRSAKVYTELLWVLSRQRTLTENQHKAVLKAKQAHGLEGIKTRDTIQSGCTKAEQTQSEEEDENVNDNF